MRIVLLGKPGSGCSSLANTILGEDSFRSGSCSDSKTGLSLTKTRSVHNRPLTLIDTSGLFHPGVSEKERKASILSCVTECAPGVAAFLIVFKVEKFTEQENDIVAQICRLFSEGALEYAVVVFTRGDQLPDRVKIQDFVRESKALRVLVEKCGGRCHVFDNTYWKLKQQDEYRSNQFQLAELLKSIDEIVMEHDGRCYTDNMLLKVENEMKREEKLIRQSGNMSVKEIREQAKGRVVKKRMERSWFRLVVRFVFISGLFAALIGVIVPRFMKKQGVLLRNYTLVNNA